MRARDGARSTGVNAESDLYAPVKAFLEGQGYVVKGEVKGCDVVGVRGTDPPVVVELKRAFSLALVLQAVDRLSLTDRVYLAIGERPRRMREVRRLCRLLGCGLLLVGRRVEVVLDPVPYTPRRATRRTASLLGEHARRVGDPNRGGASTRVPMVTAYRQEALRCAVLLAREGPMTLAAMRAADDVPNAGRIVQDDYYGWFERVARATYALTPEGQRGITRFDPVVDPEGSSPGSGPDTPPPRPMSATASEDRGASIRRSSEPRSAVGDVPG
jgi:hypothetical protein